MTRGPVAVVYRGPATLPGCPEAAAAALASSPYRFRIEFTERPRDLRRDVLYCQPGGATLRQAWRRLRRDADVVRHHVRSGGRYLGFCLGGYLAGDDPGFALLQGATNSYVGAAGGEVRDEKPRVIDVNWSGQHRAIYFQDGGYFTAGPSTEVVGRYANGLPAAVIDSYGTGWVAVVGPHPEATDDWFRDDDLPPVARPTLDLAHDLIRRLMER